MTSAALVVGLTIQGLAVARALQAAGITVYVVERGRGAAAAHSKFIRLFVRPGIQPKELTKTLVDLRVEMPEDRVVLFPCSDRSVRAIARNWETLGAHYLLSWAEHREKIALMTRKSEVIAHAQQMDVAYPKVVRLASTVDVGLVEDLRYPVILKPDRPPGGFKTYLAEDAQELQNFVHERQDALPIVAQEYIAGGDSNLRFCTMFLDHGRELGYRTGYKLRSYPPALGRGTVLAITFDAQVLAAARQYFLGTALSGPVSIEFKRDSSGELWMIEPNVGRTEYCVDAIIHSGLNLPLLEYRYTLGESGLEDLSLGDAKDIIWYDTQTDPLAYIKLCLSTRSLRPYGKQAVFPFWGFGDVKPILFAALQIVSGQIERVRAGVARRLPDAMRS